MIYHATFWGQTRQITLNKLSVAQNKIMKTVFDITFRTNTKMVYKNLKILKIKEIIELGFVKIIYKIKNTLT